MEITTVYQKERREFGRPVGHFATVSPVDLGGFDTAPTKREEYIERNPSSLAVQAVPEQSEHQVNTERFKYTSVGMFHQEGGWPKDVDSTEKEQTTRYRKKVEKDEEYIRQVKALGEVIEGPIMQNIAVDIYEEYFQGEYADHSTEPPSAKTLSVFKDPNETKRSVSSISWYPDGGKKLAVAFSTLQFQDWRQEAMSNKSYIWDVNNPNAPDQELAPSSPLNCLQYNPKDPNLLVSGAYNGLVQCWDTRRGEAPVETSIIEKSHRDPVYDVWWLQGKTAYECASTSTDGQVLWWDIRKLAEPAEQLSLDDKGAAPGAGPMGGVSLEYSTAGGKFLVGTEQGKVVACNRKAKNPSDRVGTIYEGHCGPVYALARNPFFPKYFMTVGDWTVRLWNEDIKTPVMTSNYAKDYILDATWSPTRPGVFATTKMDGTLDVWDYFYKQNEPALSLQVDGDGLARVKMQEAGRWVAAGSVDGSVYMLELCDGLSQMQQNEKQGVSHMLDRESKREKNLEARAKELRARELRAKGQAKEEGAEAAVPWEERRKEVEAEFWRLTGLTGPEGVTGEGIEPSEKSSETAEQ